MTKRARLYLLLALIGLLVLLIFSSNFYFIRWLAVEQQEQLQRSVPEQRRFNEVSSTVVNESDSALKGGGRTVSVQALVEIRVNKLKTVFKNKNPRFYPVKRGLVRSFSSRSYNISTVWKVASSWPTANEIYPQKDEKIGKVIRALQESQILRARNTPRGTQLKLVFDLAGKQSVLFKPSWYNRDTTIEGTVYSGKDRHNSEVVAFHLGAILNLRWTPVVVGRRISLEEIYEIADDELKATMISKITGENQILSHFYDQMLFLENDTRQCVYGKCHYCRVSETVCDDPVSGTLEGALLLIIPGKFAKYRSPWQRTYQAGLSAEWERNDGYCAKVKEQLPLERLLDLIDAAVFDFLIQNGDRHHYETREDRVLLMDNGKGFGNAYKDHFDILAPLYQCCMIRRTTWDRLLTFSGGALTETLRELNEIDLLNPLLTKEHYIGLERRLLLIYATVELCREKYGSKIFK